MSVSEKNVQAYSSGGEVNGLSVRCKRTGSAESAACGSYELVKKKRVSQSHGMT